jgi:hypothetical protein
MTPATEFWPTGNRDHWTPAKFDIHAPQRMPAGEFSALRVGDPGGYHHHWRQMIDGRWWICYRGTSCGYAFSLRYRPIVTIAAGAEAPTIEPRVALAAEEIEK